MNISAVILYIFLTFLTLVRLSFQISIVDASRYVHSSGHAMADAILQNPPPGLVFNNTSTTQGDHCLADAVRDVKRRKRGRRGGVRARASRRRTRPVLPVIITGNARSLNNKIDELEACTRYMNEYRDASLICLSESWFKTSTPDSAVQLDNFFIQRGDRDPKTSNKSKGGGICAYISERYCHPKNVHIVNQKCEPDLEILTLSICPYYMPREFSKLYLNIVYIPDSDHGETASGKLTDLLNDQLTGNPDSLIVVTGDLNHASLHPSLHFYQHVTQPTRNEATLDLCYTNINNAYKCTLLPPLGNSDHDMVHLLPKYKSKLIKIPIVEKTVRVWDECGKERFRDCLEMTDWNVFTESCTNIDELYDHVSGYLLFCEQNCFEEKTVKIYGNSKPWVTAEMKSLLKEKKRAFIEKNKTKGKIIQNKIKFKIKECKRSYKEKVEEKFKSNDSKSMWSGVKQMIGFKDKETKIYVDKGKEQEYCNNLNSFYSRFDTTDFSEHTENIKNDLSVNTDPHLQIENYDVVKLFKSLKPNKACGPDLIKPVILKLFAHELSDILSIFLIYLSNQILYQSYGRLLKSYQFLNQNMLKQ